MESIGRGPGTNDAGENAHDEVGFGIIPLMKGAGGSVAPSPGATDKKRRTSIPLGMLPSREDLKRSLDGAPELVCYIRFSVKVRGEKPIWTDWLRRQSLLVPGPMHLVNFSEGRNDGGFDWWS